LQHLKESSIENAPLFFFENINYTMMIFGCACMQTSTRIHFQTKWTVIKSRLQMLNLHLDAAVVTQFGFAAINYELIRTMGGLMIEGPITFTLVNCWP